MDKYQAPTTEYVTEVAKNIDLRLQEEHRKSPEEFKNYVTFLMTAFHHTSSPHKIAPRLTPEMRETLKKVKQEISTRQSEDPEKLREGLGGKNGILMNARLLHKQSPKTFLVPSIEDLKK